MDVTSPGQEDIKKPFAILKFLNVDIKALSFHSEP